MKNEKIGIMTADILIPAANLDYEKWAVVACDQYTSQPGYWNKVEKLVSDSPSTLRIILPEIYLEAPDKSERISAINEKMQEYINTGILTQLDSGIIYLDRRTSQAFSRKGIILCVDLDCYDYNAGSQTLIRATEGTVLDRLPPRMKIRENAPLELPHIMLLIDDPEKTVIEPLADNIQKYRKIYDFDLMMNGGHIAGYHISDEQELSRIFKSLEKLSDKQNFMSKYGVGEEKGVLLFAAGDGNHSLATAKAHWESIKSCLSEQELIDHPARYALVEIVNVHDEGLVFEPIHRVVFNVDPQKLLESFMEYSIENKLRGNYQNFETKEELINFMAGFNGNNKAHLIPFITQSGYGVLIFGNPAHNLEVGSLQAFLDCYIEEQKNVKIDYIHGDEVLQDLGSQKNNIGFFLPPMDKNDLFKTVIIDGVLPRKTFSMGEADEKRYYLECRKIR